MTASFPKRDVALLVALVVVLLAGFVGKAFTIDDPVYIAQARHIAEHPADPYGAVMNWTGTATPLHRFDKNPPLAAYYLALAGSALGWSEVALHAASIVPAVLCALGAYLLARRLTSHALFAALIAVTTPAFLVSATNVMCEVWMLAFWTLAVVAWLRSFEEGGAAHGWLAMLCVVLASLSKYSGVALVPLLLADGLIRSRKLGAWVIPFVLPIAALAAYELWSRNAYGVGLLSDAMGFSGAARAIGGADRSQQILVGLAFTGGSLACVVFFAPLLWRLWFPIGAVVLALLLGWSAERPFQFWIMVFGGAGVIALAVAEPFRRRNADAWLLCLWVVGVFVFAAIVNWTSNARSILPMAPALACLVVRRLEGRGAFDSAARRRWTAAALAASAAIAVWCAYADFRWANGVRDAARTLVDRPSVKGRRALCIVHWGFQYYLEQEGIPSFDLARDRVAPGDVLLVAETNTNVAQPRNVELRIVDQLRTDPPFGVHTVAPSLGASFYASVFGAMPLAFGTPKPDAYFVLEVGERKRSDSK